MLKLSKAIGIAFLVIAFPFFSAYLVGLGFASLELLVFAALTLWRGLKPRCRFLGHFGVSGIVRGAGSLFFAYIGFDAVSTAAQEARNPQRDMPIGILGSLGVCTVLYVLMALVMTGLAHYSDLNVPHPVFVAINKAGPSLAWLGYLEINVGAVAGLASVVLVLLMGQPRIFFSMARDGLLPSVFGKVHARFRTPYVTTSLTGIVCALIAGLFPIGLLGELVSIGTLSAFVWRGRPASELLKRSRLISSSLRTKRSRSHGE